MYGYAPQAACAPQMCASQMHGAHVYAQGRGGLYSKIPFKKYY
eukprot:COSAG01_NODE_40193_length_466_cov_3.487738_1_plen_42_part_10